MVEQLTVEEATVRDPGAGPGGDPTSDPAPSHGHGHGKRAAPVSNRVRIALAGALTPFAVLTVVGAVLLWPGSRSYSSPPQFRTGSGGPVAYVPATTESVQPAACGPAGGVQGCRQARFRLARGDVAQVLLPPQGPGEPAVHPGDRVVLARTSTATGQATYYFDDFARGSPLAALAAVFGVLAVVVGRRRGLAALLGLGVVFVVLVEFLLPALLSGRDPLAVALVSGAGVMIVVLYLGHGLSARTTVAVLGTLCGLALVGLLGSVAVRGTHLTGLSSDDLTAIQSSSAHVDVTGLLLAGLVIGSLGVLNDVTVTQASAVWELRAAGPGMGRSRLYGAAMRIGRDHLASTIYTLLLAYAGAALPVLLVFTLASEPLGVVVSGDLVASDVVRSLVGGIGLLAAVPLTTGIAVLAVTAGDARQARPRSGRHRRVG